MRFTIRNYLVLLAIIVTLLPFSKTAAAPTGDDLVHLVLQLDLSSSPVAVSPRRGRRGQLASHRHLTLRGLKSRASSEEDR
ncbi:hypothetical protein H4R33_006969, partial [Dimargaris cristalligena]